MGINAGDHILFRLLPDTAHYGAVVLTIDADTIVLKTDDGAPADIPAGNYAVISDMNTECDYYNEVAGRERNLLHLKRMWTGKRGYFRVDDVFPIVVRKLTDGLPRGRSRVFSGYEMEPDTAVTADDTISPRLWKMLVDINTKLGLIIERLHLEQEGLAKAESRPVNISASGIRFSTNERLVLGDMVEVKMLLPLTPPAGIIACGNVVRLEEAGNDEYAVALHFVDMDDDVRDVIVQYTLKRQRSMIRKRKQQREGV